MVFHYKVNTFHQFLATKMNPFLAVSGFLLASVLAFAFQIILFSPISPDLLDLPPSLSSSSFSPNKELQKAVKLGEGFLEGPEDIAVDKEGVIYTAVRDGWIKRMQKNGSWEDWKKVEGGLLLGIISSKNGGFIVCDVEQGLLKVSEDGVAVIASHVNGSKIRFADAVAESSDGSLYFSVPSTKFGLHNWFLDFLEAKPHGQLLKHDPSSNETTVLVDGLGFANGVALSKEEDYLIFCETWKCQKLWLKGENKGRTEIFIENLPGGPDNIHLAPDGSFWIALLQFVADGLEFVHRSKPSKYFLASFPKLAKHVNGAYRKATVVNVAADGKIIRKLDDPDGKVLTFVTTAIEIEGHLYLGGLNTNFIGKLPLQSI